MGLTAVPGARGLVTPHRRRNSGKERGFMKIARTIRRTVPAGDGRNRGRMGAINARGGCKRQWRTRSFPAFQRSRR